MMFYNNIPRDNYKSRRGGWVGGPTLAVPKTLKFTGQDSEHLFNRNVKKKRLNPTNPDYDFDYHENDYEFRSYKNFENLEPKNGPRLVCLGCSHTYGIGVSYENTYGYHLSEMLGYEYFNLGNPGGSTDGCYRIAKDWISYIQPDIVVFQIPEIYRREYLIGNNSYSYGSWRKDWLKDVSIPYYTHEENINNYQKNYTLIKHYCDQVNAKLIQFEVNAKFSRDRGRDLLHLGVKSHKRMAAFLYKQIKKKR